MEVTYIGIIAAVTGLLAMARSVGAVWSVVVMMTVFGGAAAISLPALGGSSIPPAYFVLGALGLRFAPSSLLTGRRLADSLRRQWLFAAFTAYGVLSAFAFPRLFEGQIDLPPTKTPTLSSLFMDVPLAPSPQNITQTVYLAGDLVAALLTTIMARNLQTYAVITRTFIILTWANVGFGLLDLALHALDRSELLNVVRNGGYAQLSQDENGIHRVSGSFPEASAYAGFGFPLMVMMVELWLRGIRARLCGVTALAQVLLLFASTSTTAYATLALFAVVTLCRLLLSPSRRAWSKLMALLGVSAAALIVAAVLLHQDPVLARSFYTAFIDVTANKAQSVSGIQRAYWVRRGFDAFAFSHGLGVGIGSVRSSSLIAAVAGSIGVLGCLTLLGYMLQVLAPQRRATFRLEQDERSNLSAACGWAAVLGLAPGLVAAPTADPGLLFAMLASLALGLRRVQDGQTAPSQWRAPATPPPGRAPVSQAGGWRAAPKLACSPPWTR
jgi:hypothetical protein